MNFTRVPINLDSEFAVGGLDLYYLVKIRDKTQIQYTLYLGDRLLSYNEYFAICHELPGFIENVINIEEKALIILYINSTIHGKGVGMLLACASILAAYGIGIQSIFLDDNSERFRRRDNIYIKLGMRYVEPYGPEMVGTPSRVVKAWKALVKKYGYFSYELSDEISSILGKLLLESSIV